LIGTN